MKNFIDKLYDRMFENFTRWDFGFLKLYGWTFGIILGAYFPEFVKTYLVVFATIFLILLVRYVYLLFLKKQKTPSNGLSR